MDYLDRLPVNVLIAEATSEFKITYVNKCFEGQIMGKMQAVGMKFLQDFLKFEDRYKFECAISILQREVSREDSVEVGAFQTLRLYGKERFPLYSSFLWSVTLLNDGKFMFSAPKIAIANDNNDTSPESTSSSILTTNEFVDFFQQAPIALHWLSGTGNNKKQQTIATNFFFIHNS